MISVENKALKGHAENLKEKLNYTLKRDSYENQLRKRRIINCFICKNPWKKILKLETLKISFCLNVQRLQEEHYESMNASKKNCTTETIEELDKLHKIMEDKKYYIMETGQERDMLMEQLKALQKIFNEERVKSDKGAKTI